MIFVTIHKFYLSKTNNRLKQQKTSFIKTSKTIMTSRVTKASVFPILASTILTFSCTITMEKSLATKDWRSACWWSKRCRCGWNLLWHKEIWCSWFELASYKTLRQYSIWSSQLIQPIFFTQYHSQNISMINFGPVNTFSHTLTKRNGLITKIRV